MARTAEHARRHLTPGEAVVYSRFMERFPHRHADIPPFTTDGKPGEIESWHAAGEPAVWPPVPAEASPAAADVPEDEANEVDEAVPVPVWPVVA